MEDWVSYHTFTMPNNLEPAISYAVGHLTLSPDMDSTLETCSVLGMINIDGVGWINCCDTTWG